MKFYSQLMFVVQLVIPT